jgi:hypothetical protein
MYYLNCSEVAIVPDCECYERKLILCTDGKRQPYQVFIKTGTPFSSDLNASVTTIFIQVLIPKYKIDFFNNVYTSAHLT